MSDESRDLVATPSETVGPFFHFGLATDPGLGVVAEPSVAGTHIVLRFQVTDADGAPVPDALVEIWQVDGAGAPAPLPASPSQPAAFRGFGRLPTGGDGCCEFRTVLPGPTTDDQGRRQAAHVNVCLFARGLLRHLHTRVYFPDDPAVAGDPVLALVPAARRGTLLARPDPAEPYRWTFDLRLQGQDETVFFDL